MCGILFVTSARTVSRFREKRERWAYFVFFLGVGLTAFGSAYYHLQPNDSRLVWDRIPMTIGFTGLVTALVSERIGVRLGVPLFLPLIAAGIASAWYWHVTQAAGRGDLRPYGLVQFGSLGTDFVVSLGFYALAKARESADKQIFSLGGIVSAHTLKHILAATSAYWILRVAAVARPYASPSGGQSLRPAMLE